MDPSGYNHRKLYSIHAFALFRAEGAFRSALLALVSPFGSTCARVRLPYSQARVVSILVVSFLRSPSASSFDSASFLRSPDPLDCCPLFPSGSLRFLLPLLSLRLLSASFPFRLCLTATFGFDFPFLSVRSVSVFFLALLPFSVSTLLPLSIPLCFRFFPVALRFPAFLSAFFRPL